MLDFRTDAIAFGYQSPDYAITRSPDKTKGTAPTVPVAPSSKLNLLAHQFVQLLGIEPDHHLVTDHQRGSRPALVRMNQLMHRLRITRYVAVFKLDTSRREIGLRRAARRSTRLRKDDDLL
jgi:hypothetical protein